MESGSQALEEMGFLHVYSHHCESTVKVFGSLQTYYPTMATFHIMGSLHEYNVH